MLRRALKRITSIRDDLKLSTFPDAGLDSVAASNKVGLVCNPLRSDVMRETPERTFDAIWTVRCIRGYYFLVGANDTGIHFLSLFHPLSTRRHRL